MASPECCEVPGRAWPSLCWEGQGGQSLILNSLIHTGQHGVVLSSTVPIFPVLGSAVRADLLFSGCFCSAVGAGSEETLSRVVPWPWWLPAWVTCVLLAKGTGKQGTFLSLWLFSCCLEAALKARPVQGILWIPLIALELFLAKDGKPSSNYDAVETRSSNDGRSQDKLRLLIPCVRYLDAQATFLVGHSGLSEVEKRNALETMAWHTQGQDWCAVVTHPTQAPSWDGCCDVERWFICIRRQIRKR